MPDEKTPADLRSRIGEYTETRFLDESLGVYLFENTHSETLHLWVREGTRWEWALKAYSFTERQGLVMLMRRMGCEVA